jgi:hypothetical protein
MAPGLAMLAPSTRAVAIRPNLFMVGISFNGQITKRLFAPLSLLVILR